jgi:Flp pilus assembly protein TadD
MRSRIATSAACEVSMTEPSSARLPAASCAIALALVGCAGLPASDEAKRVPAELLAGTDGGVLPPGGAGISALDDDMRAFLADQVRGGDDYHRLRSLLGSVIENASFQIEYDEDTRTAAETFHVGRGNCLSFTNLIVGMARELGLVVSYQEVEIPPVWFLRDGSFVLSRHVNAVVDLPGRSPHVVDFNMAEFRLSYPRRPISDERAAAHYFSNLGVERMQAGEPAPALDYFRRAIAMDRTLAQAWVNLGTWYLRQGEPARAEASYLEALRVSAREYVAMSSLANLHAQRGRPELARWYQRRVIQFRKQNPYYRYEQALAAYRAGDYDAAAGHLRGAIRREADDAAFHSLLGLVYRQLGKDDSARRAFLRAVELADDDDLRRAYRRKLDLLGGGPSAGL